MKVKHLLEILSTYDLEKECDVEIGNCLVPIVKAEESGECKTGVKLILSKECEVCVGSDT